MLEMSIWSVDSIFEYMSECWCSTAVKGFTVFNNCTTPNTRIYTGRVEKNTYICDIISWEI